MRYFLFIMVFSGSMAACGTADKKHSGTGSVDITPASSNTDTFNRSFATLLDSYYAMKDALIEVDTVKMNDASKAVAASAIQLPVNAMKLDSTGAISETAKSYTTSISAAASGMAAQHNIEGKKKKFQAVSDALYDLARTVRFDRQMIYHQHCPMAFNETDEAYWLSNSNMIVNPYLGKKHPKYHAAMLGCGDITDSLGWAR